MAQRNKHAEKLAEIQAKKASYDGEGYCLSSAGGAPGNGKESAGIRKTTFPG